MAAWNDGYIFDVAYTSGFYREIAPGWMAAAAMLLGHRPPDLSRPFRYAELGCGHGLSLTPLKGVMRDYAMICDSYYEALRGSSPSQIEAVDMGRRGLHNEGAELLKARLDGKVEVDHETARRLFTLVCALCKRG